MGHEAALYVVPYQPEPVRCEGVGTMNVGAVVEQLGETRSINAIIIPYLALSRTFFKERLFLEVFIVPATYLWGTAINSLTDVRFSICIGEAGPRWVALSDFVASLT